MVRFSVTAFMNSVDDLLAQLRKRFLLGFGLLKPFFLRVFTLNLGL